MAVFDSSEKVFYKTLSLLKDYLPNIVIAGGWVPLLYHRYLISERDNEPLRTKDIDIALPEKLEVTGRTINEILKSAGFKVEFKSRDIPPVITYIGDVEGREVEIEFITDLKGPGRDIAIDIQRGLHVQALRFISILLEEPISVDIDDFSLDDGSVLRIKIPNPGAFIFHKGLVFTRRKQEAKKAKDLYYIFDVLTSGPELTAVQILSSFKNYKNDISGWYTRFLKNLQKYFLDINSDGVILVSSQRPAGGFPSLDDDQFKQYVFEVFNEFIYRIKYL